MYFLFSVLLIATHLFAPAVPSAPKVTDKDLRLLTGAQWTGTLTYLDYRSNKKVSIPSTLTVTRSAEDKRSWVFDYKYPDEPKADEKETVTISKDGRAINGETVTERTKLPGGTLRIVIEKKGRDNDRDAVFRFTYLLNAKSFSIKKEVRYEGTAEFFERNEFSWKR